jgi:hypothetical protein
MKNKITRRYSVTYQLGAVGSNHRSFSAALKALTAARRTARRNGDRQGITITVTEYVDRCLYGAGSLTAEEADALAAI